MKINRNVNGFSLVGVLVASVIVGLLSVFFATMLSNSKKGQTGVQNSIDFDVLRSSIALVLKNPVSCAVAFKDAGTPAGAAHFKNPPSSVSVSKRLNSIVLGTTTIAKVGMNLGGGLKINKLELRYVSGAAPNFLVALLVEATKVSGSFGSQVLNNTANPFYLKIKTSGNAIVGCDTTEIIRCNGVFANTLTTNSSYVFPFSAAQCGGSLPTAGCLGVISQFSACYSGEATFQVLNAGEAGSNGVASVAGPGISAYISNLCAWTTGPHTGKTAAVGALYFCR